MSSPDFMSISIFIFSYPDVIMPAYVKSRFYVNFYVYFHLSRCNDANLCQVQILYQISIFIFSYPDVMMPAYAKSRFYSVFYIAYLSLELYFIMNLVSELQTGYLLIVMDINRIFIYSHGYKQDIYI